MARALRDAQMTPADQLRELLSDSEKLVVSLRGRGAEAQVLLDNLDAIEEVWPKLEAAGVDLRPEAGRRETLHAAVRNNAPALVRELSAAGGIAALRRAKYGEQPAPWWWHLDEELQAQREHRLRRAAIGIGAVVLVGALAIFLFQRLFPVDPNLQKSVSAVIGGQQNLQEGDLEGALAEFQEAVRLTPDDPEPWAWLGVVQQQLGMAQEAEESNARLRALIPDEVTYHNMRSQVLAAIGMSDEAIVAAQAALALDPESPEAYFNLGSAYENQGQIQDAIKNMELASQYAEARGKSELTVVARYRMGMLMQQFSALPPPTPAPDAE
jgi:tetratricopeptide (TPR) repeat protein